MAAPTFHPAFRRQSQTMKLVPGHQNYKVRPYFRRGGGGGQGCLTPKRANSLLERQPKVDCKQVPNDDSLYLPLSNRFITPQTGRQPPEKYTQTRTAGVANVGGSIETRREINPGSRLDQMEQTCYPNYLEG